MGSGVGGLILRARLGQGSLTGRVFGEDRWRRFCWRRQTVFRRGAYRTGPPLAAQAFLNERRRQDDRKAHDQEEERQRRRPLGQAERSGQRVDGLKDQPGGAEVDDEHLPERPAMHLVDQFLQHPPVRYPVSAKISSIRRCAACTRGWSSGSAFAQSSTNFA